MPVRPVSASLPRAVYSVSETAKDCSLSRPRFYELVKAGVMPPPCYDLRTRKPMYPAELHDLCVAVRQTNIGIDGQYVLFYTRRTEPQPQPAVRREQRRSTGNDNRLSEIVENLRALGVTAPEDRIAAAVSACYPGGVPEGQFEAALRTIFLHLRRMSVA